MTLADSSRPDGIDSRALLFRLRKHWPLFVGSLVLAGLLACLHIEITAPVYVFRARMLLDDESTGSPKTEDPLQARKKSMELADDLRLITSAAVLRQTVSRLPYAVSYFTIPNSGLNQLCSSHLPSLQVCEQLAGTVPFRVQLSPAVPQLTGVRLFVAPAGPGRYRLRASAAKAYLSWISTGKPARKVLEAHVDTTVAAGDTLRTPLLRLVLTPVPGKKFGPNQTQYCFIINNLNDAVRKYAGSFTARPFGYRSPIVELYAKSSLPAQGIRFLDTLMAVYMAADLREKNIIGRKAVAFLDDKLTKLAATLRAARGVMNTGARSSGIQLLHRLEGAQAQAQARREYCQNMLQYLEDLEDRPGIDRLVSPRYLGIESPALDHRILKLRKLNARRLKLGVSARTINPGMAKTDQTIRATRQSLVRLLTRMNLAAETDLRDVNAQLARVRGQRSRRPENERPMASWLGLEDSNEQIYAFLEEKRNQAAIALATSTSDKHIVDQAHQLGDGPESPEMLLVALLALLAGLAAPIGLVLLLDGPTTLSSLKACPGSKPATGGPGRVPSAGLYP
ncbi:hypothetical protein IC235_05990 [Hymenobacter sp. BT664]|uniref:Tyrosine-protein kinase G-rich domain-containing protein n=1 Tax=Hymenobacter montanus TaxID=2771359 RepID=A0A927GIT5_9BACT|nr:GNVR domain-containing protein [Hymenobacter montanus]MBD2767439.1 hypothetical protein [Hymenobacter montanus]